MLEAFKQNKEDNEIFDIEHCREIHTIWGKLLERRKTKNEEEDELGE